MSNSELEELARLMHERNSLSERITRVIGRPSQIGHIGEFIASRVFDIQLEESAVAKGFDGRFKTGTLNGQTVNVKFYAKKEGLLDIRPDALPNYFLVMTGPSTKITHSRGEIRPWYIDFVFLFHAQRLVDQLKSRGVKIGTATSVVVAQWNAAEIYPNSSNREYSLDKSQVTMLQLFRSDASQRFGST